MKILITGVSGFVGNFLSRKFFLKKHEVYGVSKKKIKNKYFKKIYYGNLSNKEFVNSIDNKFDLIINCAANTNHFAKYSQSYEDNVLSLRNILHAKKIICKKLIHISTEAVFLNNSKLILNSKTKLPKKNSSIYAITKRMAEIEIFNYKHKKFKKLIILRPRIIWDTKFSPVFKKLKIAILKRKFFWIDNGNYYSPATNIHNLAKSVECSIKFGKNKSAYFILDHQVLIFRDLVKKITGKLFEKHKFLNLPRLLIFALCYLSDFLYFLSLKKVRLPLSISLYYLTLSPVFVDDSKSKLELHYKPDNY